ncbi:MAG: STAS domain-containing protein [Actinobacteria bacterium]|nr:STAS domain-containing protein [Actinomycetota bacterium]
MAFRFRIAVEADVWVLSVGGEIDVEAAPQLLDAGRLGLDDTATKCLMLDLAEVHFIDSTGLGAFVQLRNDAHSKNKDVQLRNVPHRVARLLELTGLDSVFPVNGARPDGPDSDDPDDGGEGSGAEQNR